MTERRRLAVALGLLAPVVLLVYAGMYDGYFLRDDFMWLRDAQRQWAEPSRFWTTRPSGYLRPVSNLFFGIEYALFGLAATGYLVVNALLHLTNACLLGALLAALGAPLRLAAAAAASAGLMVTAVPGVVWISDIVSLLALGFILAAALFQRRFVLDGHMRDGALALLCVALAAGSRENGVLAGVGIILVELHHAGPAVLAWRSFWLRMAPFVVLAVLYLTLQSDLANFDAVARSDEGFGLGAALWSWVANLPALVAWRTGGGSVSHRDGLLLLGGLVVLLGALGGTRGLVAAAWVLGFLLLALAPYALMLAKSPTIAGRYRYEAVFAAAVAVAALFSFSWGAAGTHLRGRAVTTARALVLLLLVSFLTGHARATADRVDTDERFAYYADQTHAFVDALDTLLVEASAWPAPATLVLAGAPVENPRHLHDQLVVFHGWPEGSGERVEYVDLDLESPAVREALRRAASATLTEDGGPGARAYVWDRKQLALTPALDAEHVYGKLRYDWRRPKRPAVRARLRVLRLQEQGP